MSQKKLNKILILTDLFIQEIDGIGMNNKTVEINNKLKEINELLLPILDKFYENKGVSKTNFYQTIIQKFNYIFEREFKRFHK